MADQSIFNGETSPTTNSSTSTTSDPTADLLKQIVNEKGEQKYKTVQDALVGLQNAQAFIQTLKTEKQSVQSEVEALKATAAKVTELEKVVLQLSGQPKSEETPQNVLSEEAIAKLVETTLTKTQQKKIAQDNINSVVEAVKVAFGDKAEEVFYTRAKELGMDPASINELASKTPKAALKLLGFDTKNTTSTTTKSSINTVSTDTTKTESFIGRNTSKLEIGATASQLAEEQARSKKMVDELSEKGMSINDLTNPSAYFKFFK